MVFFSRTSAAGPKNEPKRNAKANRSSLLRVNPFKANMSRQRALKVAQVVQNKTLEKIAKSDVYWDKVVSIKPLGVEKVYDIEVPSYHNFVAENIVIHNSIEQDADVVMFLYHEDEDDRENVVLEIAKHRNGPLGQINLRFIPKQVSFYPVEKRLGEGNKITS